MPEAYGGSGLGIAEAALVMQAVAQSGAGFSGASAVHMNIFGLHPVVVFGSDEQKRRFLPPLIAGKEKAAFAVTEPDVGLDTTRLKTRAVRDGDHYIISGRKIWTSTAQVAEKVLLLTRTTPFEAAARPSAGMSLFYTDLDRAKIEVREIHKMGRAAAAYEAGADAAQVGAFANAAKYFAAEAGHRACETAVLTHGGMGYAREFHVERFFREIQIARIAPISGQLILSHIAERVLGLPKSY